MATKKKTKVKTKNKVGRPPKIDSLIVQKLEQAFSYRCTDEKACFYAGISRTTLDKYQKQNPEFVDRKQLLKSKAILLVRQTVFKGITGAKAEVDNNGNIVRPAMPADPSLGLKWLERVCKNEFSPRTELTGGPMSPYAKMTDTELDAEWKKRLAHAQS